MRTLIKNRLSYLYKGELFGIITFIFLSLLFNRVFPELRIYSLYSFWVSFILLEFLLLQGTVYWYVKWKRLIIERNSITPIQIVKLFNRIRKLNIIWIFVTPLVFVIDIFKWYPILPRGGLTLSGFIYIFACLEYVNYFHFQLSYDNFSDIRNLIKSKKLKKSSLNKDFRRIKWITINIKF